MADSSQSEQPKKDGKKGIIDSIRENPKLWASGLYVWLSLFGALYAYSYYHQFNINVFDFIEPSDFLLIALANETTLSIALITFFVVILLLTLVFWILDRIRKQDKPTLQGPDKPKSSSIAPLLYYYLIKLLFAPLLYLVRLFLYTLQIIRDGFVFLAIVLLLIAVFLVPLRLGKCQKPQYVRVTLRQDAAQPEISPSLPNRTLFLGTTSRFHFFYECKNTQAVDQNPKAGNGSNGEDYLSPENGPGTQTAQAQEDADLDGIMMDSIMIIGTRNVPENENTPKCENGRPFVIPTANIASLEFNPPLVDTKPKPLLPDKKCRLETSRITHFPESEHDRLENSGEEELTKLFNKMNRQFEDYRLDRLILTGRVDTNKFNSEEKREFYGTQIELARARAEWVHGELLKKFPTQIDPQQITLRTAGPQCIDPNTSNCDPALDRAVEVYACWTLKPKPEQVEAKG